MDEGTLGQRSDFPRALVIDDDEWVRNQLAAFLRGLGVSDVDLAVNGDGGWELLERNQYGLIVLDWKLPGLSGLTLFNRIRKSKKYRTTPLLVVSGYLERFDFRLLQEFPCTALMEKPFTKQLFVARVEELLSESDWYGQNVAQVDSLLSALNGEAQKLATMLRDLLDKAPNPVPLAMIVARRLLKSRMLKHAETVLRGVLKIDDGCVVAMNELGKVLHLSGRHQEALEVLRRASQLSPSNLQRLCLMGEVELNMADVEAARASFSKALALDAEDATAKAGAVIARNMQEVIGESASGEVFGQRFASMLNTIGITYVRTGKFTRGIEQYHSAMTFVRSRTDSARVAFNLGLGYLRWGKPDAALPWFKHSAYLGGQAFAKSSNYVQKLTEVELSAAHEQSLQEVSIRGGSGEGQDAHMSMASDGAKVISLHGEPDDGAASDSTPSASGDNLMGTDIAASSTPVVDLPSRGKEPDEAAKTADVDEINLESQDDDGSLIAL